MGNKKNNYRLSEDEKYEKRSIFEKVKESYFIYSGRLNRKKFATRTLNSTIILVLASLAWISLIALIELFISINDLISYFGPAAFSGVWLAANISLGIRRAHDLNRSTSWYLWLVAFAITVLMHISSYTTISLVVDIVIALFFVYCYFFHKGTEGDNKYGKDMVYEYESDSNEVKTIIFLLALSLLLIGIKIGISALV